MPVAAGPESPDADPIHLDRVRVAVGGTTILDGVDLTVAPGEAVAILGANGSGKSTLIRSALGQVPMVDGDARLFGIPVGDRRRVPWPRVGYVPQRITAQSGVPATSLEVVGTGLLGARRWWLTRADRARARDALDALDVADLADRPFAVLSGGQAQRVVIARALVREPDLLLLDEPLAGVDVLTQSSFAAVLAQMHAQRRTIVMVLHELGPFAELIDRAVVMRAGRVIHDGPLPRDHAHHAELQGHGPHGAHDHLHHDHGLAPEPVTQRSLP